MISFNLFVLASFDQGVAHAVKSLIWSRAQSTELCLFLETSKVANVKNHSAQPHHLINHLKPGMLPASPTWLVCLTMHHHSINHSTLGRLLMLKICNFPSRWSCHLTNPSTSGSLPTSQLWLGCLAMCHLLIIPQESETRREQKK